MLQVVRQFNNLRWRATQDIMKSIIFNSVFFLYIAFCAYDSRVEDTFIYPLLIMIVQAFVLLLSGMEFGMNKARVMLEKE